MIRTQSLAALFSLGLHTYPQDLSTTMCAWPVSIAQRLCAHALLAPLVVKYFGDLSGDGVLVLWMPCHGGHGSSQAASSGNEPATAQAGWAKTVCAHSLTGSCGELGALGGGR